MRLLKVQSNFVFITKKELKETIYCTVLFETSNFRLS